MTPVLTVVVPSYRIADLVPAALDSALDERVEIIAVDDGSPDATGAVLDAYAASHPGVRVIHQENKGHGGAVNAGVAAATGTFVRVLDADDWFNREPYGRVLDRLETLVDTDVDLLLSNFVYENVDEGSSKPVRFTDCIPADRRITWEEVGRMNNRTYFMMHALTYRTETLRASGLRLPEHTFYVDNVFALLPLPQVRALHYVDANLYGYRIGRPGQSVSQKVLLRQVDQHARVTRILMEHMVAEHRTMDAGVRRYSMHFLRLQMMATSALLTKARNPEADRLRHALWDDLEAADPVLFDELRKGALMRVARFSSAPGKRAVVAGYSVARRLVGFN